MKIFRNIIAVPAIFLSVTLIYMALRYVFLWLSPIVMFWIMDSKPSSLDALKILALLFILGIIPCGIAFGIMMLVNKITDNKKVKIISSIIPSIYCGIYYIYATWKIHATYVASAYFSSTDVSISKFQSIIFTLFYIALSAALIIPAFEDDF